ncbi:MAG: preprotein translocase subunit SecY [Candidatus Altiarchaeota archaeon]|nr:preprotein translocase subunit SecY [Candidatus Altiarchaeota archaeon]
MVLGFLSKIVPEVRKPIRRLSFNERAKWTIIVLALYFLLGNIPLHGLSDQAVDQFQNIRAIMAGNFGSIITLGIGPIVTASIILQLLVGSSLLPIDVNTEAGKKKYGEIEKIAVFVVTLLEAGIYVFMGGLPAASPTLTAKLLLVLQLCLGTYVLVFLDQISSRWGFLSGISLFIAAGVSSQIVTSSFSPAPNPQNPEMPTGIIWAALKYLGMGDPGSALSALIPVFFTLVVFAIVVYTNGMKIEIPLSFARVRGSVTRWPLSLFYTSNIPVIFTAALIANLEMVARILAGRGLGFFGAFDVSGQPISGLIMIFVPPRDLIYYLLFSPFDFFKGVALGGVFRSMVLRAIGYTTIMTLGSIMFARFWVYTSNMDSAAVAKQIQGSGFGIPGFRRDPRILKKVLDRYIPYLTDLGAIAVGLLAAFSDFTSVLSRGTGILLAVMIIYKAYETIVTQYAMDMSPGMRGFFTEGFK